LIGGEIMKFLNPSKKFLTIACCVLFVACIALTIVVIDKNNQITFSYFEGIKAGAYLGAQEMTPELAEAYEAGYTDGWNRNVQSTPDEPSTNIYYQISEVAMRRAFERALENYFGP
jgi:hypothetical protein